MITQELLKARRASLAEKIGTGAILLPCYPSAVRNNDNMHVYRQESSLLYFSGFQEEESCMLFRPGKTPELILFVRPKNPTAELWDGFRYGVDGVKESFGADEAYEFSELENILPKYLDDVSKLYYQFNLNQSVDRIVLDTLDKVKRSRGRTGLGILPIYDSSEVTGDLRIVKAPEEMDLMRKTCDIAANAHKEAMKLTRVGMNEKQIHGALMYMFMREGAEGVAYEPIVATGSNATVLHYKDNNSVCEDGDILLIDAGCEYQSYASDITRSFPVNGKFSSAQKDIYQAVLDAQIEVIEAIKPGVSFDHLQKVAEVSLSSACLKLGLLRESLDEVLEKKLYRKYYPHNIGHWLGLDVHDRGRYTYGTESRLLEPGFVLTVEPGLYIPKSDESVRAEFRGVGIRIEDDILVSETSYENLTAGVPKEIVQIEELMKEDSFLK